MGLKSILKRKFITTTQSKHDNPITDNVLNRDFTSTGIGKKWVSDITYISVGKHWSYLTIEVYTCFNQLIAQAQGGSEPYQYSLDGINYHPPFIY